MNYSEEYSEIIRQQYLQHCQMANEKGLIPLNYLKFIYFYRRDEDMKRKEKNSLA